MPQFDFFSFSNQVFTTLFFFLIAYTLLTRYYFFNFTQNLKSRLKLIYSKIHLV
jgi:hypothetical protein